MSGVTSFPDGVADDGRQKFLAPMLAPELLVLQITGNDLSWVGASKGYQPITSTNPDGDYSGVPVQSAGAASSA